MEKEFCFQKTCEHPELLTREMVASFLGVCVHSVDNYRRYKGLPSFKFGGHVRFSLAEVLKWLESQRRMPEPVQ